MKTTLTESGIHLMGEIPWGGHVCLFYETKEDLLDVNVRYFEAGLGRNEACVWAISDPITERNARRALRERVRDIDLHIDSGRMDILPGYQWYLKGDEFDSQRITRGWHEKLEAALARGHQGLRISGNAFWMEAKRWDEFHQYEEELEQSVAGHPMLVLCTYSLKATRAVDILDVARTHQCTVARRRGRWEFLETPELKQAKREIRKLDEALGVLSNPFSGHTLLTQRERAVLAQIVRGASSKEAGRTLHVSLRTIDFHRANLMRKLGAKNIAQLLGTVLGHTEGMPGKRMPADGTAE